MIEVDLYHINNYLRHKTNLITFHKCVGKKKHLYIATGGKQKYK